MIVGFFKLMFILITLPIWLIVWFFKARAVIRAGRPVYPVKVIQLPPPPSQVQVYLVPALPPRPG